MILAIAAAFVAGATVIGFISDYEAEAAPKKPKPPADNDVTVDAIVNKLDSYENRLIVLRFSMTGTVDEIGTGPFTNDKLLALFNALDQIEAEAEDVSKIASDARDALI